MSDRTRAQAAQVVRGLYGIADASYGDPVTLGEAMLAGGCRLVQLRAKSWDRPRIEAAARQLLPLCQAVDAGFVINDDAPLAAALGAPILHLGQQDGSTAAARAHLGPEGLIGRSTHSVDQALAAWEAGADYIAFGPCFPTPNLSRPKPVRGLDLLSAVRAALPAHVPLVAIGGITHDRLPDVRAAGADSWAIIGAICGSEDPAAATRTLLG